MHRFLSILLIVAAAATGAVIQVRNTTLTALFANTDSIVVGSTDTLMLMEPVFLDSGKVMVMQAGVVVKADTIAVIGHPDDEEFGPTPALIVRRGARLYALGTKDKPVIFTTRFDSLNGNTIPMRTNPYWRGLWGGVVLCGRANVSAPGGAGRYTPLGTTDDRLLYGGNDNEDFSGIMRYVSIRYAGTGPYSALRDSLHDRMFCASLALCGVGSKTVIEYVETYRPLNDGVRFLGGTVNTRFISSVFALHDNFDIDEGYRGHNQFWLALCDNKTNSNASFAIRHGGHTARTAEPFTRPVVTNATIASRFFSGCGNLMGFSHGAGGMYLNSIFTNLPNLMVELAPAPSSWDRTKSKDLRIENNIFWRYITAGAVQWNEFAAGDSALEFIRYTNEKGNPRFLGNVTMINPDLRTVLDFHSDTSLTWTDPAKFTDYFDTTFIKQTCFKGAFDPSVDTMWIRGWTGLDAKNYLRRTDTATIDSIPRCFGPPVSARPRSPMQPKSADVTVARHRGAIVIRTDFDRGREASISLYSLNGKCLSTERRLIPSGSAMHTVKTSGIAHGVRIVRIVTEGRTFTRVLP